MPSVVAVYPIRPRLPSVQTAGHKPEINEVPGRIKETSMYPPVKP